MKREEVIAYDSCDSGFACRMRSVADRILLAVFDLVIIIVLIVFIIRNRNNPKYTEPISSETVN